MHVVGLTGGIACGKSTVSAYLASRPGVEIVDLDLIARDVVEVGRPAWRAVVAAFPECQLADGSIDRKKLGDLVFADASLRRKLGRAINKWIAFSLVCALLSALLRPLGPRTLVIDAPLLFETPPLPKLCCETICVAVSPAVQEARLRKRDACSADAARKRIAAQMPVAEKVRRATRTIWNDGTEAELTAKLDSLAFGFSLSGIAIWLRVMRTASRFACLYAAVAAARALRGFLI